jgi:hypothetical protein
MLNAIKGATLRELISASYVETVRVVGSKGGYIITVRRGANECVLAGARGAVRLFTLTTAAKFLGELGLRKFEVDVTEYEPGRLRKPRPDRAEALRKTRTTLKQANLI